MNIGDVTRKRAKEVENEIARKKGDIELAKSQIKDLELERRQLAGVLKALDRTLQKKSNGSAVVSDEQVLEAVKALTGGRKSATVNSAGVAEHLGVTRRNVARKLRKLVDDRCLTGNPEKGYALRATSSKAA